MQHRETLASLKQKINRTRVHIALPVTMAIFGVLTQPTTVHAQNNSQNKIALSQDTINMKPIKDWFYKLVVKDAEDQAGIDSLRNNLETYPREYQAAVKQMVKNIYQDSYLKNSGKLYIIGLFLDPNKENRFGKVAYKKTNENPELKRRLESLLELFQGKIELIKSEIELAQSKKDLQEINDLLKTLTEWEKLFKEYGTQKK